jgi:riboflavin synthase
MFTGIVQHLGTVKAWKGPRLFVKAPLRKVRKGDSVSIEGVCLTVVSWSAGTAGFDLSEETLQKTTLGALKPGDRVNVEGALRAGDPLGGHYVQGHVEGVGKLVSTGPLYRFEGYPGLSRCLASKGSVAVDGVSLTVVDPSGDYFSVALIPHTLKNTTLGLKKPGAPVNIESDMIARQVAAYLEKK